MKAYVIKCKKDGKYLSKYFNYDYADKNYKHICGTKNIINAKILKECFDTNDDFECVEITIAEGDLEQQLAEYENFMRENEWSNIDEMRKTLNKCEEKYKKQWNQLAEKDKEIEKLKAITSAIKTATEAGIKIKDLISIDTSDIRHQVCDEIRKQEIRYRYDSNTNSVIGGYFIDKEILDQIEKGEMEKE